MASNRKKQFPMEATYRDGPRDGEKLRRSTNKFSRYRTDAGQRMSTAKIKADWKDPLEDGKLPRSGYRLVLLPGKVVPRAEYWYHSVFWDRARDADLTFGTSEAREDWAGVDAVLARHPEITSAGTGYAPHMLSTAFDICCWVPEEDEILAPYGDEGRQAIVEFREMIGLDPELCRAHKWEDA